MNDPRHAADDLLDVARVLLLVQGSILVATTVEAVFWSFAFPGASGSTVVMSAAAAAALLVGRARLRGDRRWTRRLVYVVEGALLVTLALDTVLALLITGATPPAVALLTRLVMPVSVIVLLRRTARTASVPLPRVVTMEGAS